MYDAGLYDPLEEEDEVRIFIINTRFFYVLIVVFVDCFHAPNFLRISSTGLLWLHARNDLHDEQCERRGASKFLFYP